MRILNKKGDSRAQTKKISLIADIAMWVGSALVINLILEILQRRSLIDAIVFAFTRGHLFLISTALIMLFTSPMLIVKRKLFALALPAFLWIAVGITNTICLAFRPLPISFSDFRLAGEAVQMMHIYLTLPQIILIVVGVTAAIFALVALFVKAPRFECSIKKSMAVFIPALVLLLVFAVVIEMNDFFPRGDETPNEFYERNGFAYNFFKSAGSTGVNVPNGYSDDEVENLIRELSALDIDESDERPNIIVLQLESFFDITTMHGVTLTKDPIPNFRKLKESTQGGYLFVPSYGGGTSNVEFEVLSGMNLDHFTIGESPYYTLLKKNVLSDSLPFNMKKLGYTTHAIHNHSALFYERTNAYNNMGFDTFTSLEYMNGVEYNSQTWAKDDVLADEIISALDSTDDEDFVFTVSVQGHGPYPTSYPEDEFEDYIRAEADNLTEEECNALSYYASTIGEMDEMLGELISKLEECDEKCVLVVYGDHLPAIDFSVNYISAPNAYTSEYVVWSNYGLEFEGRDLEAYALMAYVEKELGLGEGILTRYHQYYSDNDDYQEKLKLLEYSMTNDDTAVRTGSVRYSFRDLIVKSVTENNGKIIVKGENFTPFCRIAVNGVAQDTVFENPSLITADVDAVGSDDVITVVLMSRDGSTVLENIEFVR